METGSPKELNGIADTLTLKSAKSDRYLSPFEISATARNHYVSVDYNGGGRFADVLAKTY